MLQCEGKYARSSIVCHVINALEDRIDVLRPQQEVFRILHSSHLGRPVLCNFRTQPAIELKQCCSMVQPCRVYEVTDFDQKSAYAL